MIRERIYKLGIELASFGAFVDKVKHKDIINRTALEVAPHNRHTNRAQLVRQTHTNPTENAHYIQRRVAKKNLLHPTEIQSI